MGYPGIALHLGLVAMRYFIFWDKFVSVKTLCHSEGALAPVAPERSEEVLLGRNPRTIAISSGIAASLRSSQ